LTYWISEPDKGQSDAINKGFNKASGVYGNWINSDDLLAHGALHKLAEKISSTASNTVFLGKYEEISKEGKVLHTTQSQIRTLEELVDIQGHWRNGKANQIGQQSTFFPLEMFRKVGMLNVSNHHTMDYELWGKFLLSGAVFEPIDEILGKFRIYKGQKISFEYNTTSSLIQTAKKLIKENEKWTPKEKAFYISKVNRYWNFFRYSQFRSKIGLKRRISAAINALSIR
jgi:hypothetical protein